MTTLIPVIYKKDRTKAGSSLNFHTHKCFGGVLNPKAVHGNGHYVRRVVGQNPVEMLKQLCLIKAAITASSSEKNHEQATQAR